MGIQWIFPQLEVGVASPDGPADGGFGPVYLNDQITLLFSPANYTGDFTWYCDWQDTEQGAFWTIPNPSGSPLTYTFNETTPNASDNTDTHICHFYNLDGTIGNSQTFQYFNYANKTAGRTRWTQAGTSPIVSTTTSASASVTTTGKPAGATGHPSSAPSAASSAGAAPTSNPSDSSPRISVGAAVGITIGAIAVLLALLAFLLRKCIWRSRYAERSQYQETEVEGAQPAGPAGPPKQQDQGWPGQQTQPSQGWYGQGAGGMHVAEKDGVPAAAEKDGVPAAAEKDGSAPAAAEKDGSSAVEPVRSELPAHNY